MKLTFKKQGEKFDWDTDDLVDYVEQNIDDIVVALVETSKTARLFRTQTGIKYKEELMDVDVDFDWQDGGSCTENTPNGTVTFGKKYITVGDIEILLKFCNKDLVGLLPQTKLAPGAGAELETLPFEQVIIDQILAKNAIKVDNAIWKSDLNSANPNLNKFDGIIKEAGADATVIDLSVSGGQITESNSVTAFKDFDTQIEVTNEPLVDHEAFAYVTDKVTFKKLLAKLYDDLKDSTHYFLGDMISDGDVRIPEGVVHPLTGKKIWWVPGLKSTGMVFGGLFGAQGQFVMGTDLEHDFENVEVWYEKLKKSIYVRMNFRLGATYRLGKNVALFRPTAS